MFLTQLQQKIRMQGQGLLIILGTHHLPQCKMLLLRSECKNSAAHTAGNGELDPWVPLSTYCLHLSCVFPSSCSPFFPLS